MLFVFKGRRQSSAPQFTEKLSFVFSICWQSGNLGNQIGRFEWIHTRAKPNTKAMGLFGTNFWKGCTATRAISFSACWSRISVGPWCNEFNPLLSTIPRFTYLYWIQSFSFINWETRSSSARYKIIQCILCLIISSIKKMFCVFCK